MRPSATFVLGAAVCVAVASQYPGISPALADPSYTSDKVIDVFLKNKAAVDAYKAETRTAGSVSARPPSARRQKRQRPRLSTFW